MSRPTPAPTPAIRVPRHAIPLLALQLFLVTFSVNLQAPLVPHYAAASGYGAGAQALAFACYVGALVPTLLLLAGLSDRVGRRLPLAAALLRAHGHGFAREIATCEIDGTSHGQYQNEKQQLSTFHRLQTVRVRGPPITRTLLFRGFRPVGRVDRNGGLIKAVLSI